MVKSTPPAVTVSSMPPPLRDAVKDINEFIRVSGWVSALAGVDQSIFDLLEELEAARDRIVSDWKSGDTSKTDAARAIRHLIQRFVFRIKTLGNSQGN